MTQSNIPDHTPASLKRRVAAFTGLVALYLAPTLLGLLLLLLVASRQAGANAFRYVGF